MHPDTVVLGSTGLNAAWYLMTYGVDSPTEKEPNGLRWGGDIPMNQGTESSPPWGSQGNPDVSQEDELGSVLLTDEPVVTAIDPVEGTE